MRQAVDAARLRAFMHALAQAARDPVQVYLVGGATAVAEGWRNSTIDVDLALGPGAGAEAVLRAIPAIKESLNVNVELASPADFIPVRPGWEDRSPFVAQEGPVTFRHFDLYAQALAKIERGHETDRHDVAALLVRGLIERTQLRLYFDAIEPELYRFPGIDPAAFRRAVELVANHVPLVANHSLREAHQLGDGNVFLQLAVRGNPPAIGTRQMQHRFAKGFRGNGPRIDLGPPQNLVLLDDCHALAQLGSLDRTLLPRGASTDRYAVVMFHGRFFSNQAEGKGRFCGGTIRA